ncbi:MAG: molybdenum ABC transporter ATP-binding protein [Alphaproteobacteria bacterium]|nr:molybdenum ABC transporter ATP-binding protein [Alphaproteobacteria bacterium]
MTDGAATIDAKFAGTLGSFSLDLAFEAPMRGITALFGPSGCGKTTVLRCMAGLNRLPGRLSVGGEAWQDDAQGMFRKPHQRPIGYVFQEASLFPHLSVRRNLFYGSRRAERNGGRGVLASQDVIDLLGIGHLLDRAPTALSGGERQRVAVGRALLSQPRLLLMDEPLSGLDRMTKEEILPYLEALHNSLSIPIIYVSHDIGEVARLADRVILLSAGRRVADGPVTDILERLDLQPATGRFEAGVVLTARVVEQDAAYSLTRLDHHGQSIALPFVDIGVGEEVRLRIRARDVSLATRKPEGISIRNVLSGTIVEIVEEPRTAFAEALVDIGGGRLRARLTREAVSDLGLEVGMPVFALIKSISFDRRSLSAVATDID